MRGLIAGAIARDVMESIRKAQWRLDALKAQAPESLQPATVIRERRGVAPLEEWR